MVVLPQTCPACRCDGELVLGPSGLVCENCGAAVADLIPRAVSNGSDPLAVARQVGPLRPVRSRRAGALVARPDAQPAAREPGPTLDHAT
jgi:hypothetical protein